MSIWLLPLPIHPPLPCLSLSLPVCRRSSFLTGEGGGGGANAYDGEKAWFSINHSILSSPEYTLYIVHCTMFCTCKATAISTSHPSTPPSLAIPLVKLKYELSISLYCIFYLTRILRLPSSWFVFSLSRWGKLNK
jgi:hypothetical protein